jgi:RNA-directed DNA polymerase
VADADRAMMRWTFGVPGFHESSRSHPRNGSGCWCYQFRESGSFTFLGFEYRRILGRNRKWRAYYAPKLKKRTALLAKLKEIFRQNISQPVERVIEQINPILRGWVNYFAVGDSSECFSFVRDWVEKKVRGHLMRAREQTGFGWKRWSRKWLYGKLGLYKDYRLRRPWSLLKVQPVETVP